MPHLPDPPVPRRSQPRGLDQVAGEPQGVIGLLRAGARAGAGLGDEGQRPVGQAGAPPASAASSAASARSRAGLRLAGLPSHQPPYSRQTLCTMNSGSSYTGRR